MATRKVWVSRDNVRPPVNDEDDYNNDYTVWAGKKPTWEVTDPDDFPQTFHSLEDMQNYLRDAKVGEYGRFGVGRAGYTTVCPEVWEKLGFPKLKPGQIQEMYIAIKGV